MTEKQKFIIECRIEHVARFREWLKTRGGIAHWKSIDFGSLGQTWQTPALTPDGQPTPKPTWRAENHPTIVTDENQIGVYTENLYKEFKVAARMGSQGFSLKLTDGSQRTLDKVLAKCRCEHGSAHYKRGSENFDGPAMQVFYTESIVPLSEIPPIVQVEEVPA
jgi:hypothetical protein